MNPLFPLLAQADPTAMPGQGTGTGIGLGTGGSTFTDSVDPVWNFLFWTSVFFTALIVALMVLFIVKYRQKDKNDRGQGPAHSTPLEITWTAIPLVLVLAFFAVGFRGYVDMSSIPDEGSAEQVIVEAYKWGWNFQYVTESGVVNSNTLYVPNDRPIKLILQSSDVIHSFYVPAFRIKKDCVPGRYNQTWFMPTKNGEFDLFCAEYCGQAHSAMITKAVVMDPGAYRAKLAELNDPTATPPLELGKQIYENAGCAQCHSTDGSAGQGPSFKNLYGREEVMADGTELVADGDYIIESIEYPMAKIVAGYQPVMPSYKGRFKDAELRAFVEWTKSISPDTYDGPVMETWETPEADATSGEGGSTGDEAAGGDGEAAAPPTSPAPTGE